MSKELPFSVLGEVVFEALDKTVKTATKYVSPNMTIKATRRQQSRKAIEVVVTIGKPNYAERQFIKACKKAGEPFPVKKIQLKYKKGK